jgi:hypothetical protein
VLAIFLRSIDVNQDAFIFGIYLKGVIPVCANYGLGSLIHTRGY